MGTILNKLLASKGKILIILLVIVFAWAYILDRSKKSTIHPTSPAGKTLEEIMSGSADNPPETAWDKDFKSAVEPM
jgi:hypothetical protein